MKGKKLKVSATTANGVYEREITLSGKNVDFTAGHVYKFSVNMESATFIENTKEVYYELVTDASTLKAGDEVIIATPQYSYALSTSQSNNNRGRIAVTISEDKIYDPDETVQIVTLEGSAGAWYLKVDDDQYLYTTSSQKNMYLRTGTKTQQSIYNTWAISISNGNAEISAKVDNQLTKYLIYNNSSSVFSVNTSKPGTGNNRVALYRKTEGEAVPSSDDPILKEETFGAYLNGNNTVYVKGSQQLSREYQGDKVTFAILDAVAQKVVEFSGIPAGATIGDAFALTLRTVEGKKTVSTRSYTVTVVGEAGAKLWLSDGAGNGFIVKR